MFLQSHTVVSIFTMIKYIYILYTVVNDVKSMYGSIVFDQDQRPVPGHVEVQHPHAWPKLCCLLGCTDGGIAAERRGDFFDEVSWGDRMYRIHPGQKLELGSRSFQSAWPGNVF